MGTFNFTSGKYFKVLKTSIHDYPGDINTESERLAMLGSMGGIVL